MFVFPNWFYTNSMLTIFPFLLVLQILSIFWNSVILPTLISQLHMKLTSRLNGTWIGQYLHFARFTPKSKVNKSRNVIQPRSKVLYTRLAFSRDHILDGFHYKVNSAINRLVPAAELHLLLTTRKTILKWRRINRMLDSVSHLVHLSARNKRKILLFIEKILSLDKYPAQCPFYINGLTSSKTFD